MEGTRLDGEMLFREKGTASRRQVEASPLNKYCSFPWVLLYYSPSHYHRLGITLVPQ